MDVLRILAFAGACALVGAALAFWLLAVISRRWSEPSVPGGDKGDLFLGAFFAGTALAAAAYLFAVALHM